MLQTVCFGRVIRLWIVDTLQVETRKGAGSPRRPDGTDMPKRTNTENVMELLAAAAAGVTFQSYQARVEQIANRLTVANLAPRREKRGLHHPSPGSHSLSTTSKTRIDLLLRMLAAVPPRSREQFVVEMARQARKHRAACRYLRYLATPVTTTRLRLSPGWTWNADRSLPANPQNRPSAASGAQAGPFCRSQPGVV